MPTQLSSLPQPLESNGHTLQTTPERLGWLEPSDPQDGVPALRDRLTEHGYVWLKGLLPKKEVLAFRRHFFQAFSDTGLLKPGSDPVDGLYAGTEDGALAAKRLMEVVRSAAYEAFCLHPNLWRFLDELLGGPSYLHKRKIARYTRPGDPAATGAHYDLVYLRGGTDRIVTAWIPIGDVPVDMGGLIYLEGSHRVGKRLEAEFRARNADLSPEDRISAYNRLMADGGWISKDLPAVAERLGGRWLVADYEAGDIVLHSPYMVHAATTNRDSQRRLRLSTDIRYQNVRDEIDARWSNHWSLEDML